MITTKSDLHIDLEYLLNEVKLRLSDKTDHLPNGETLAAEYLTEEDCEIPGGQYVLQYGMLFVHCDEQGFYIDHGVDCSDPDVGIFGAYEPAEKPIFYPTQVEAAREIVLRISTAMEEDHKAYLYELALENAFDY